MNRVYIGAKDLDVVYAFWTDQDFNPHLWTGTLHYGQNLVSVDGLIKQEEWVRKEIVPDNGYLYIIVGNELIWSKYGVVGCERHTKAGKSMGPPTVTRGDAFLWFKRG
jgi:hypothetical protein